MMGGGESTYLFDLKKAVLCIVGPTASGKTSLAQLLAQRLEGEILSADSMQIYKGMDIGTGKIPVSDRAVPHWGLDLREPGEPYSAALFQHYARSVLCDIDKKGKQAIVCGGTGLYVRAAVDDYRFVSGDQVDNEVREIYTRYAEEKGKEALWKLLKEKDPESAELIHPNNTRRVIRAFEMLEEGKRYHRQRENLSSIPQAMPALFIGLEVDPHVLNDRIDERVDKMVSDGLVDEVRRLLKEGFREGITAPQAIGYKEIVAAIDGTITLAEAIDAVKTATRRYAKRQRTWFKKDTRILWLSADKQDFGRLADDVCEIAKAKKAL